MLFQPAGAFVDRGPGGHHVVEQQESLSREVAAAFEGTPHILAAFLVRQVGLGRRGACAHDYATVDR